MTLGLEIPLRHGWLSDLDKKIDQACRGAALYLLPFRPLESHQQDFHYSKQAKTSETQASKYCPAWEKSKTLLILSSAPQRDQMASTDSRGCEIRTKTSRPYLEMFVLHSF